VGYMGLFRAIWDYLGLYGVIGEIVLYKVK